MQSCYGRLLGCCWSVPPIRLITLSIKWMRDRTEQQRFLLPSSGRGVVKLDLLFYICLYLLTSSQDSDLPVYFKA